MKWALSPPRPTPTKTGGEIREENPRVTLFKRTNENIQLIVKKVISSTICDIVNPALSFNH